MHNSPTSAPPDGTERHWSCTAAHLKFLHFLLCSCVLCNALLSHDLSPPCLQDKTHDSVNAVTTVSKNSHLCHACVQRGRIQRCSSLIAMQRKAAQAWCFSHHSLQMAMAQTGYNSSASWRRHELAAVRIMLHL